MAQGDTAHKLGLKRAVAASSGNGQWERSCRGHLGARGWPQPCMLGWQHMQVEAAGAVVPWAMVGSRKAHRRPSRLMHSPADPAGDPACLQVPLQACQASTRQRCIRECLHAPSGCGASAQGGAGHSERLACSYPGRRTVHSREACSMVHKGAQRLSCVPAIGTTPVPAQVGKLHITGQSAITLAM